MEELQFAGGSCSTTPSVAAIMVTCNALIAPLRLLVRPDGGGTRRWTVFYLIHSHIAINQTLLISWVQSHGSEKHATSSNARELFSHCFNALRLRQREDG